MKTHKFIAAFGIFALGLNLFIPGMAYGQHNQQLTAVVNCNGDIPATQFGDVPGDVSFYNPQNPDGDPIVGGVPPVGHSIVAGQTSDAIDTNLTFIKGIVPTNNILEVIMGNSAGADDCPLTNGGFIVTAAATDLTDSNSDVITASNIKMITTPNVVGADSPFQTARGFTSPGLTEDGNVLYSDPEGLGNLHDVVAPLAVKFPLQDLNGFNSASVSNYDHTALAQDTDNTFTGGQQLTVLGSCTGHGISGTNTPLSQYQTAIGVGVALTVHITNDRPHGAYSGTITYTENSQDCPQLRSFLSSAISPTDTNLFVINTGSIPSDGIILIDGELMKITGIVDSHHLTVIRAIGGSIAAAHDFRSNIYLAGRSLNDPTLDTLTNLDPIPVGATSFTVTTGTPYHIGDILIMSDGERVTVSNIVNDTQTHIGITTPFLHAHNVGSGIIETNYIVT